jgi:hypothetical protein
MPIVRIATSEEVELYKSLAPLNDKNGYSPRALGGKFSTLLTVDGRVFLPTKLCATLDSVAFVPDASLREVGLGLFAMEKAACERAKSAEIDELVFWGSNAPTSYAAMSYCGYSKVGMPLMRKILTCE